MMERSNAPEAAGLVACPARKKWSDRGSVLRYQLLRCIGVVAETPSWRLQRAARAVPPSDRERPIGRSVGRRVGFFGTAEASGRHGHAV